MTSFPDFCLSCGSSETHVRHPLFEGGLCVKCKVTFDPLPACALLCSILAKPASNIPPSLPLFAGELLGDAVSLRQRRLPVLLHRVLRRHRGHSVRQPQLLQVNHTSGLFRVPGRKTGRESHHPAPPPQVFLQGLSGRAGQPGKLRQGEGHRPLEVLHVRPVPVRREPQTQTGLEGQSSGLLPQQHRHGVCTHQKPFPIEITLYGTPFDAISCSFR